MDVEAIEQSAHDDSISSITDMDYDPNEQLVDDPSLFTLGPDDLAAGIDHGMEKTTIYFVWVGFELKKMPHYGLIWYANYSLFYLFHA